MTSTTAWIRPLNEATAGIPTPKEAPKEVRGSRCRTRQGLFTEWAAALGFPEYFGHNWDAFGDCLRDAVSEPSEPSEPPMAVVVREAGDLLADEPENVLALLLLILGQAAGDDSAAPRLLLLLDDTPDRLTRLLGDDRPPR
ncbi:barstar family protein [Streptomyces sp. NPDC050704]|uniref:barstar family protein n=1 Tax=Streptomyces sp. NPDC050704 TaxID=3157219 RepID=UPI0034443B3D